jgi:crotonobetainyl-CoA:carnitine CoA-transferase CaiB-like acyl-CoA transferase
MMQAVNQMSTPGALSDVRILDFSRVLAGPFATMMLADLGATVTKVERPGTGDETRSWGPPYDAAGEATYFQSVNRNKRSVVLDLSTDPGRDRALALARASDVLVENFRPGVMDRLGLGYEQLRAADPAIVYCSITGFGSHAGAQLPGYDLLVQALGGLMSITGSPHGEPQKVGVALVDVLAGLFASVGILAALRHRDATGEGQRVEVDLLSSLLAALVNQASAYTIAGVVPGRLGNAHPSISPYELYETGAGELVLAVGNDRQFAALCEVLGAPGLAADERFATNGDRVANRAALRAELVQRLAQRAASEWAVRLTAARVPAGLVNDVGAAFALAQSLGLAPIVSLAKDDGGTVSLTRNPIHLSRTPPTYRSAPPSLPRCSPP